MEHSQLENGANGLLYEGRCETEIQPNHPDNLNDYLCTLRGRCKSTVILTVEMEADRYGKVFNDPVHGHIKMHPLLVKIIDTEEFQRLRELKTLGMSYHVYPGANHRRFEHSIGVAHLAGRMVQALAERQPELGISRSEILCVMIAGLLHDIGHGPFSHTWERFMDVTNPEAHWKHESMSVEILNSLLEKDKLLPYFDSFGLGKEDIRFIKEQIYGPLAGTKEVNARPAAKRFLYDIVANKSNGVDVDKWDYLARDGRQVNIDGSFDYERLIKFSRVLRGPDGETCIAFSEKEAENVYDMFHVRYQMHKRVYQHRVVRVIDAMLVEALKMADPFIHFRGSDGSLYIPSAAYRDPGAFCRMDDGSIIALIKTDVRPQMVEAQKLLKRIAERRLYARLARTEPRESFCQPEDEIVAEIVAQMDFVPEIQHITPESVQKNLLVIKNNYDYGKGAENPLESVWFFTKSEQNIPKTISRETVSNLLPHHFREMEIYVFYRSEDPGEQAEAKKLVDRWLLSKDYGLKHTSVQMSLVKRKRTGSDEDISDGARSPVPRRRLFP